MLRAAKNPPKGERTVQRMEVAQSTDEGRVTAHIETHHVSGYRVVLATQAHIVWTERFSSISNILDAMPRMLADSRIRIAEPAAA